MLAGGCSSELADFFPSRASLRHLPRASAVLAQICVWPKVGARSLRVFSFRFELVQRRRALSRQLGLCAGPKQQSMRGWRRNYVNMSRRMAVCDAILPIWLRWRVHLELHALVEQLEELAEGPAIVGFPFSASHDTFRHRSAKPVEFGGHAFQLQRAIRSLQPSGPWAKLPLHRI